MAFEIKRDEDALATAEKQSRKTGRSRLIHAGNRDVEDRPSLQKGRLAAPFLQSDH